MVACSPCLLNPEDRLFPVFGNATQDVAGSLTPFRYLGSTIDVSRDDLKYLSVGKLGDVTVQEATQHR